jgi:hypothetical protein
MWVPIDNSLSMGTIVVVGSLIVLWEWLKLSLHLRTKVVLITLGWSAQFKNLQVSLASFQNLASFHSWIHEFFCVWFILSSPVLQAGNHSKDDLVSVFVVTEKNRILEKLPITLLNGSDTSLYWKIFFWHCLSLRI